MVVPLPFQPVLPPTHFLPSTTSIVSGVAVVGASVGAAVGALLGASVGDVVANIIQAKPGPNGNVNRTRYAKAFAALAVVDSDAAYALLDAGYRVFAKRGEFGTDRSFSLALSRSLSFARLPLSPNSPAKYLPG
jgi:hypothetical protein